MHKWFRYGEHAAGVFISILVVAVIVGAFFAILAHFLKSEIAAVIATVLLAMFITQITHK